MDYGISYPIDADQVSAVASNIRQGTNPDYTIADFLSMYPQFGATRTPNVPNVPTAVVQLYIDLATASVQQSRWHAAWKIAIGLFVAHFCTKYLSSSVLITISKVSLGTWTRYSGISYLLVGALEAILQAPSNTALVNNDVLLQVGDIIKIGTSASTYTVTNISDEVSPAPKTITFTPAYAEADLSISTLIYRVFSNLQFALIKDGTADETTQIAIGNKLTVVGIGDITVLDISYELSQNGYNQTKVIMNFNIPAGNYDVEMDAQVANHTATGDDIVTAGATVGIVTGETAGSVSYSMDIASIMEDLAGFGDWKTTAFGVQLATLAKMHGKGGMGIV